MAEKKSRSLECAICFLCFETTDANQKLPRNFPCPFAHTFCSACVISLSKQDAPKCPTCREPPLTDLKVLFVTFVLDCLNSFVQTLRTNTALLEILQQDAPTSSSAAPTCADCEDKPVSLFCN